MKRSVLGLVESITFFGSKKRLKARIDSGATTSYIDSSLAEKLHLSTMLVKKRIRSAHGSQLRPLVRATIVLKNKTITGSFTLAHRSHMTYPVLIGQNILKKGKFLIDPLK